MNKQELYKLALDTLSKIPGDVVNSAQSAVNISPPVDLARRLQTNKAYLPYGGVPQSENQSQAMQNIKDALQASHLIGYASPLRALTKNPLELSNGQTARLLGSGKGWEIIDRLINK